MKIVVQLNISDEVMEFSSNPKNVVNPEGVTIANSTRGRQPKGSVHTYFFSTYYLT